MAAAIEILLALLIAAPLASAQDVHVERFEARTAVFVQDGLGWQSQAGVERHAPGSEQALIVQPILATRIRQDDRIWHDVMLPVDVVSAASPDALDAVSSASRDNESFSLDIDTHIRSDSDTEWTISYGGHIEETFRSGWIGAAIAREIADDNAVLTTSFDFIADSLDTVLPNGYDPGATARWTASLNASLSQMLSPTTVVQVGYGFTAQAGQLATTWNSIPWQGRDRVNERLPATRSRHAGTVTLRQAIPESRTFALASYRFYVDDFGILAHTAEGQLTQYLHDDVWLRAGYRFHTQTGASFYTELYQGERSDRAPRTADSDLSPLDAHEVSASVRWFYARGGATTALRSSWLELGYVHYERTNSLRVEVVSLGWGQAF